MKCELCQLNNTESNFIFETDSWLVLANFEQIYIGRSVFFLKRHAASLTDLNEEEFLDFMKAAKKFEHICSNLFNPTLFNWTILVNNSYRVKPYNPHAHWHVRPRYDHDVVFEGEIFKDKEFGEHYSREDEPCNKGLLLKISSKMREEAQKC